MKDLEVVRCDFQSFHGGLIPRADEPPVAVEGLNALNVPEVEQRICTRLARELQPAGPLSRYLPPAVPVTRLMKASTVNSLGEVSPISERLTPLGSAHPVDGSAHIERDKKTLRVTWEADLCFTGLSEVMGHALVITNYRSRRSSRGNIIVDRFVPDKGQRITTTDAFDQWRRNPSAKYA